jgi:predicted thioesterase
MERFENLVGLNKSFELSTDESMVWDEDSELSYLHLVSTSSLIREVSAATFDFMNNYLTEEETSILTSVQIEHLKPVVVGEQLVVGIRISEVANNRIIFRAMIMRESEKVAEVILTRVVVSKSYLRRKALENI